MVSYSYLALGDSYTIGEQVSLTGSFPYQAVQLLRQQFDFFAPEIIATTGWTTDELSDAIAETKFLKTYDFVTLLIGVNNQYRGRTVDNFSEEFTALLKKAIQFADNKSSHVIVLSIPDWGVTPFANGGNAEQIATDIDAYNTVCKTVATAYKTHFIDITTSQRMDGNDSNFLAADQLHPSAKEYAKWAGLVSETITKIIAAK